MKDGEIKKVFGFEPQSIGNRYRGHWIVEEIGDEEECGNAKSGYLCVNTRDGGGNPIDAEACKKENFVGTSQDGFDCTYRYYYYHPIETKQEHI